MTKSFLPIKQLFVFEYFYYFYYLTNRYSFIFFYKDLNFIFKLINFNKKIFLFFPISPYANNSILNNKKLFVRYNNFKLNYNFNNLSNWNLFIKDSTTPKTLYLNSINDTKFFLYNIFFLFSYSMFNTKFKNHHLYNFFHVLNKKNKLTIVHTSKFIARWKNSYDLLFNMFYYNFNYLLFSTPSFKKQTLSMNWNYNNWNLYLWKFYSPFFIFQPNKYNKKIDFFFKKLKSLNVNFFVVTDCFYHYKNLFYFKKNMYYTIGLVNINDNPWVVSYPIISFFDNYLIQLFFFKLLIYIQKQAFLTKFIYFKKIWSHNIVKNIISQNK